MGTNENLDIDTVRKVMEDMGKDCILIGGWASYLHLQSGSLSHDVDAILNPLYDKARVVGLIGANQTHLNKMSGEIRGAKVDLYMPYTSRLGDIPVERLVPYVTRIHGVQVLIPEAHLLTKAACLWDDSRFLSPKRSKDAAEVRGMMHLSSPEMSVSLWASLSERKDGVVSKWASLLSRASADVTRQQMKKGFAATVREWSDASKLVEDTLSGEYGVDSTTAVVFLPARGGTVAKFHFKGGAPSTVDVLNNNEWASTHAVAGGIGRELPESAKSIHPFSRVIPADTAQLFAQAHGSCIACGKPLTDDVSVSRGYGADCAKKFR